MLCLTLTPISSSTFVCSRTPPSTSTLTTNLNKPFYYHHHHHQIDKNNNRAKGVLICRAGLLSDDGPFIVAIGSSMLSSLFLATPDDTKEDDDAETLFGFTETRFGVMGIISFIPFFNWLSWVFAWLDTQERRSNLSLSPEESWLPIASIIFCIVHVQLEASIRNGDLQGFQLFNMVARHLSNHSEGRQEMTKEERKGEDMNLPQAEEQSSNDIRQWRVPRKPSEHPEDLNGDGDDDKSRKQ